LATAERPASFAGVSPSRAFGFSVERIRIGCVHAKGGASEDTAAAFIIPWRMSMPDKRTIMKARKDKRAGKAPSTQAGEFVREEIHKIRRGEHGARSPRQAIAIGLSEARRAGVDLPPPKQGKVKARTRKSAEYAYEAGQRKRRTRRRPRVSRAVSRALKREPRNTASRGALSRQARTAAARRSRSDRSAAARKAGRTKGSAGRSAAARKGARTRARRRR
jgi:Family of unknown function (DUF6496)